MTSHVPGRWLLIVFAAAVALLAAPPANAETRSDTYAGATCTPYPHNSDNSHPYQSYLYGFRQTAYCHFTRPEDWNMDQLAFVLFEASVETGTEPLRARLCFYATITSVCGDERRVAPRGMTIAWVGPPASPPRFSTGGYLQLTFPRDRITLFSHFVPFWSRSP